MSLRQSLACALLIAGGWVVSPAIAQNYNSQNPSPVAQAAKTVNDARLVLKKAQLEVQKVRDKTKAELMLKPQWVPITAEMNKAQNDVTAAKRAAMNVAHNKPEYMAAAKERDDADKVRLQASATPAAGSDDNKVSDADLVTANNTYITAATTMKKIEKQVMIDDQPLNDANARLDAAKAKMAQLDAEVDESLKTDQAYQQLQMAVATAQQGVDQAEQQLTQARQQMAQQAAQQRASQTHTTSSSGRR
jgi:predicted  nucleic acid-binding Zn-ribbon protein